MLATTYRNSRSECFFRYFFVRYFRYLFESGTDDDTVTPFASLATFTSVERLPVLPPTFTFCLRKSAKAEVLKTLSSHGLRAVDGELEAELLLPVPLGSHCFHGV